MHKQEEMKTMTSVIRSINSGDTIIRQTVLSNDRGPKGEDGKSLEIQDVGTMNGVNKFFLLGQTVNPADVLFMVMNGVIYTEGYSIDPSGISITLNLDDDKLPTGKLQIGVLK